MLEKTLNYFREISKIPRCSYNESWILSYFENWAKEKKYNYKVDSAWNIFIYVPWTPLRENEKTVILQWHMDMVCVKTDESNHDFKKDEIKVIENDWYLQADWTTLWSDDGIWLAIAMASCEFISHPPLELLFTNSEEVWLIWASNLQADLLKWDFLISLDSEDEWEIYIWCSWWARVEIKNNYKTIKSSYKNYEVSIKWLLWWHSWCDINKNRANIIFEFLKFINSYFSSLEIWAIKWWVADNAIPSNINAIISIENIDFFKEKLLEFLKYLKEVFEEQNIIYEIKEHKEIIEVLKEEDKTSFLSSIIENWNWIISMSDNSKWFVRTSRNLWTIDFNLWKLELVYLYRSSKNSEFDTELKNMEDLLKYNWFDVIIKNKYYWWEEDKSSDFVKDFREIYEKIIAKEVWLISVHAWLECWIINSKLLWRLKTVSIWPNIFWAHTTKERCEIRSVWVICELMEEVLKKSFK